MPTKLFSESFSEFLQFASSLRGMLNAFRKVIVHRPHDVRILRFGCVGTLGGLVCLDRRGVSSVHLPSLSGCGVSEIILKLTVVYSPPVLRQSVLHK